jgi:nucleotide-binding universal stress UspA family protein
MGTIVVGYDASESARNALRAAVEVAHVFGDDVHVVMAYEVSRVGGEVAELAGALREHAEHIATLARDQAAGLGAVIETEVVDAREPDALVDVADRLGARMLVVGSRGKSPLRGALVGSTPHTLLQVAGRPVLVVPG